MRKLIISASLILSFSIIANAQSWIEDMVVARQMVDSLKQELKTAKGDKRIDCLNLLAATYDWIWDDNDKHLDSACMYAEQAYDLAKKSNYKKGLGYATLEKANCFAGRTDNNINNNNTEANYLQAQEWSQKAIKIGEEIKDFRLVGDVYNMLKWLERWRGSTAKYKDNVEKAIYYYEKPVTNKLTAIQNVSQCDKCQGNERLLGGLYQQLAEIVATENKSIEAAKEYINKATYYYEMTGNKNSLGGLFSNLRQTYFLAHQYKLSEEAAIKSISYFQAAHDIEREINELTEMCKVYEITGEFEKGVAYGKRSIKLAEGLNPGSIRRISSGQGFFWVCRLYKIAGDYETALEIIRRGRNYYPNPIDSVSLAYWSAEIGDAHRLLRNYDSALYYLKPFEKSPNIRNNFGKISLGYLYLDLKQYDRVLEIVPPFLQIIKGINIMPPVAHCTMIIGNALYQEKKYTDALRLAREAQSYLKIMDGRVMMINNYKLLSDIFSKLNINDSAYYYLKLHSELKDSLLNRQLYWRLSSYKKEAEEQKNLGQIKLLEKDNLIKAQQLQQQLLLKEQSEAQIVILDKNNEITVQQLQIKDQELKQQLLLKDRNQSQLTLLDKENKLKDERLKQQATLRNALLAGLLLFLALSIFVFRSLSLKRKNERLQNEKRQAELQQKASELEMQALRAQMNPHFIFNCLSSINKFILKNDTDTASDYLTRFSRLIRQSLTNSQLSSIPLSDEIEMLRLYLDMERLRFSESFNYNIIYENTIEPETIYIPPMLLQPFCENAIWHGLMHKEGQGKLDVIMNLQNGELQCVIADNGIGREKAAELKSKSNGKQKSFGLKITTERLALFNNEKAIHSFYKTEDVLDPGGKIAGTKVILNIKFKNTNLQSVIDLHDE